MITVIVADDQRVVRDGLTVILSAMNDIRVAGVAKDGAEAVAQAEHHDADVVLMDLRMPGVDGIEATRRLRTASPGTAVVALTTYLDDESVLAALQAGATGYLTKNASAEDIHRAIHAAAAGQTLLDAEAAARLLGATRPVDPAETPEKLSPRERDVLRLIAQGLTNAEIADRLFISGATVKTHINQIFAKTHSRDRAQAILTHIATTSEPEARPTQRPSTARAFTPTMAVHGESSSPSPPHHQGQCVQRLRAGRRRHPVNLSRISQRSTHRPPAQRELRSRFPRSDTVSATGPAKVTMRKAADSNHPASTPDLGHGVYAAGASVAGVNRDQQPAGGAPRGDVNAWAASSVAFLSVQDGRPSSSGRRGLMTTRTSPGGMVIGPATVSPWSSSVPVAVTCAGLSAWLR